MKKVRVQVQDATMVELGEGAKVKRSWKLLLKCGHTVHRAVKYSPGPTRPRPKFTALPAPETATCKACAQEPARGEAPRRGPPTASGPPKPSKSRLSENTWVEHPVVSMLRAVSPVPFWLPSARGNLPSQVASIRDAWQLGAYFGLLSPWVTGPDFMQPPRLWPWRPSGWPHPWDVANMSFFWPALSKTIPGLVCVACGIPEAWVEAVTGTKHWRAVELRRLEADAAMYVWFYNLDMDNMPVWTRPGVVDEAAWEELVVSPWTVTKNTRRWDADNVVGAHQEGRLTQRDTPRPQPAEAAMVVPAEAEQWVGRSVSPLR